MINKNKLAQLIILGLLFIGLILCLSSCNTFQGLSSQGMVVEVGKEKSLIAFPCINQKPFTKPCVSADYFNNNEFDSLYVGMKVQLVAK